MLTRNNAENSLQTNNRSSKHVKFLANTKASTVFIPLAKSKISSKNQDRNKLILGVWIRLSQ